MISDNLNNLDMLLRDFKPYGEDDVKVTHANLTNYAESERFNMEQRVDEILDQYTLQEYLNAKGGIERMKRKICSVIEKAGVSFENKRVLEFGAGTCKLSATISSMFDVSEIWCLDHAEKLLNEIAPRVVKIIGGDLSKFRFVIGDMNSAFGLAEKFDAVVCYGAVHHLHLPEYFFDSIHNILNPGGFVLILDEPTLPVMNSFPYTQVARFKAAHNAQRRKGDNETAHTVNGYTNIFGKMWDTQLVHITPYSKYMPYQPYFPFMSHFLLRQSCNI